MIYQLDQNSFIDWQGTSEEPSFTFHETRPGALSEEIVQTSWIPDHSLPIWKKVDSMEDLRKEKGDLLYYMEKEECILYFYVVVPDENNGEEIVWMWAILSPYQLVKVEGEWLP